MCLSNHNWLATKLITLIITAKRHYRTHITYDITIDSTMISKFKKLAFLTDINGRKHDCRQEPWVDQLN